MKRTFSVLCGFALLSLVAYAQTGDQAFVNDAAQTDMTEAHLGQLAQTNAKSQAVKDYAQMLVTDHTNDYTQLTAVATKNNLTVPKGLDAKHEKMVAPFEKLTGAAFDAKYAKEMVVGHTSALAAYKQEADKTSNADLKTYATNDEPILQKHLDGAKALKPGKK